MPDNENPISRDAICRLWPLYESQVRDRLHAGAKAYGDASFYTEPERLLDEIAQELMDVTGWAFILWVQVHRIKQELQNGS